LKRKSMNDLIVPLVMILLAPLIGGLVYGFERIIKARMQRRLGPPLWQPFYDFLKLAAQRMVEGTRFSGVVYAHQLQAPIRPCIDDLELIATLLEVADLANRVEFIPY